MPQNVIQYPDERTWLAARKLGVGASDVATILGVNPYKSAYTLWCEKTGSLEPKESTIGTRMGKLLEPFITELYEENTGRKTIDPGDFTVWTHPDIPYLSSTPDRIAPEEPSDRSVELKTMGEYAAKQLKDGDAPLFYQAQLQCQLACLEITKGDIAVLVGNRTFEVFEFERNDRFIKAMEDAVMEFWFRVQSDDPPPVDGSQSTADTLKILHPKDSGEVIALPPPVIDAVTELKTLKQTIKNLEEEVRIRENIIKASMGSATFGEVSEFEKVSWKTQSRKGFYVEPSEFRVLRIGK